MSGRILSPETAEQLLTAGPADLVALGRALVADPAWPRKVAAGRSEEVWPCVGCMACQLPAAEPGIGCPINAESGREAELTLSHRRRSRGEHSVWGTGLPGLEAARVAALRGHEVTIYAAGWPLGGLLGLRSVVPGPSPRWAVPSSPTPPPSRRWACPCTTASLPPPPT